MMRIHLWFLTLSIVFVSMMATLMPGRQSYKSDYGKMTVNWSKNYANEAELFTDDTWMSTCYRLQRAVSRGSNTERDGIKVSCDGQTDVASTRGSWGRPHSQRVGLTLDRQDEANARRDLVDCRPDQCDNAKKSNER
jgi:hypothetical protein